MKKILATREALLIMALIGLIVLVSVRYPSFASPGNLAQAFNDTAILIILALAQMTVILTRAIDLSTAANLCLTGMAVAMLNARYPELHVAAIVVIAGFLGLTLGAINGLLVWRVGIPSIVTTLGTMTIYRGLTFVLSGGAWVNADQMSPAFVALQRIPVLGLPILSWFALIAIAGFWFFLRLTATGRAIYAVGVNPVAAVYTGINVGRTQFIAFCVSGFVSGVAGYLWVSRYVIASVEVANGYELNVVAACVIGGVSIAGGLGSVAGATLGALFLGLIGLALPVANISPFWQLAISGAAILIAIVMNARGARKPGRRILKMTATP